MKIVIVAYMGGRGGVSRQISMLANYLVDKGHDVTLIALVVFNPCFYLSPKIKILDLTAVELKNGIKILNRFLAYRRALLKIQPDVSIHYNLQSAYFTASILSTKKGKIIYSERGDPYDSEYSGLLGLVRSFAIKRIHGFVFQSEGARNFFSTKIQERSVVIHNPVSIHNELIDGVKTIQPRIINIGRLHHQKNQKLLIEAFHLIANDFKDYILEIYGDGELEKELNQLIVNLNLQSQVKIYPSTKNIFNILRNSNLFVLSSDFEGMPNVLLEAMTLGVPCVSTDCRPGGARTLIENGVNGFITPVRDVEALSKQMRWVLENPDKAKIIGENAKRIAESHRPEDIIKKWESFLYKVVDSNI